MGFGKMSGFGRRWREKPEVSSIVEEASEMNAMELRQQIEQYLMIAHRKDVYE